MFNLVSRGLVYVVCVIVMTACGGSGGGSGSGDSSPVVLSKSSDYAVSWTTTDVDSCEITNGENSGVFVVPIDSLSQGKMVHNLSASATFTLTCTDSSGAVFSDSASAVGTNEFPQTAGYYGSSSSSNHSWAAIVNLSSPITFTDRIDFNSQVDSYCSGLGYVGVVKTVNGDFANNSTYYLQTSDGVIAGSGPSSVVLLTPSGITYSNIYTNRRNIDSSNGNVGIATMGLGSVSLIQSVSSPTSGDNQMVLCQTSIPIGNTMPSDQTLTFQDPGPVTKVYGVDTSFTNTASGESSDSTTYVSSDPTVATVNSSGAVTIVSVGTTTITASKTGDSYYTAAQASYTLTVRAPIPAVINTFETVGDNMLAWAVDNGVSCDISNDQNSQVKTLSVFGIASDHILHGLPNTTTFTMTCSGEDGTTVTLVASPGTNSYPQRVGYYGSNSSSLNSWAAIVNLTTPITYTDHVDFNAQVDSYCADLGYIGVVKTRTGDFAVDTVHYLQNSDGVIAGSGPSAKVTFIPGDATYTNVYTNRRHHDSSFFGGVGVATIGSNKSTIIQNVPSPTSGDNQMVLCQTDMSLQDSIQIPQSVNFSNPGPVNKLTTDASFTNAVVFPGTGTVNFSSSNTAVATVDVNGEITIIGVGTTTITVTITADETFTAGSSSDVLNVN